MCEASAACDTLCSGYLFHKRRGACRQYFAVLKFESGEGPKRIDLYDMPNKSSHAQLLPMPIASVLLTDALGIRRENSFKVATGNFRRYPFKVLTTTNKYLFAARAKEEREEWITNLDQIIHGSPVPGRIYEFRVLVFPTKHTEQLRLLGEYVLRVTNTEVALYSGSAGLQTIFRCPLDEILRTQHSAFSNQNPGLYSTFIDQNLTVTCLAIHTGSNAPVGEGVFIFCTPSAAEISNIITQRRNTFCKQSGKSPPRPNSLNYIKKLQVRRNSLEGSVSHSNSTRISSPTPIPPTPTGFQPLRPTKSLPRLATPDEPIYCTIFNSPHSCPKSVTTPRNEEEVFPTCNGQFTPECSSAEPFYYNRDVFGLARNRQPNLDGSETATKNSSHCEQDDCERDRRHTKPCPLPRKCMIGYGERVRAVDRRSHLRRSLSDTSLGRSFEARDNFSGLESPQDSQRQAMTVADKPGAQPESRLTMWQLDKPYPLPRSSLQCASPGGDSATLGGKGNSTTTCTTRYVRHKCSVSESEAFSRAGDSIAHTHQPHSTTGSLDTTAVSETEGSSRTASEVSSNGKKPCPTPRKPIELLQLEENESISEIRSRPDQKKAQTRLQRSTSYESISSAYEEVNPYEEWRMGTGVGRGSYDSSGCIDPDVSPRCNKSDCQPYVKSESHTSLTKEFLERSQSLSDVSVATSTVVHPRWSSSECSELEDEISELNNHLSEALALQEQLEVSGSFDYVSSDQSPTVQRQPEAAKYCRLLHPCKIATLQQKHRNLKKRKPVLIVKGCPIFINCSIFVKNHKLRNSQVYQNLPAQV